MTQQKTYWIAAKAWGWERSVTADETFHIRVIGEAAPAFHGTMGELVAALKLSAGIEMGVKMVLMQNDILNAENGNLHIQNSDLKGAVIRAGKACEEAATQLMAKDAEIERHKSENRRLLDKNECLRKSREGAATDANQYLNEIERLRKELAALLDAACVNRYESMAIKDTFSKAIDRAATALSR